MTDEWRDQLEANRRQKDHFFAQHRQSPIPPEEREEFTGLEYYDPDPDYRVETTVTVHDDPETVELDTSAGRTVQYRHVVTFGFDLDGERHELAGYRQEADEPIFVPFRDKTTGQETYEGGRYMELEPDRALESDETVIVDFNLAYAPFCAYSDTFDCPLPPEDNWLETAIEAGERTR